MFCKTGFDMGTLELVSTWERWGGMGNSRSLNLAHMVDATSYVIRAVTHGQCMSMLRKAWG